MFIIDRIEDDWAVIEYNQKTFNIPKEILPSAACEGDVLELEISINKEATEEKKERIRKLFNNIFES